MQSRGFLLEAVIGNDGDSHSYTGEGPSPPVAGITMGDTKYALIESEA